MCKIVMNFPVKANTIRAYNKKYYVERNETENTYSHIHTHVHISTSTYETRDIREYIKQWCCVLVDLHQ